MHCIIFCAQIGLGAGLRIIRANLGGVVFLAVNKSQCKLCNGEIFTVGFRFQIFIHGGSICSGPETKSHIIGVIGFVKGKIAVVDMNRLTIQNCILPFPDGGNHFVFHSCNSIFEVAVSSICMEGKISAVFQHRNSGVFVAVDINL